MRNLIRRLVVRRPGLLPATAVAAALMVAVVAPGVGADPGPDAGVANDPAGDGVDCDTDQPRSGLDAAVDFEAAAVGITTDGDLIVDLLMRGDLAAFVRKAFSAATEVVVRLPGTDESIVAYDQQHDGVHDAQVVDPNGAPVPGTGLATEFLNPEGRDGAGIRFRVRGLKIADDTSPLPAARVFVTFNTYSMVTSGSPRVCDRIVTELTPMWLDVGDLVDGRTLVDLAQAATIPTTTGATTATVSTSTVPAPTSGSTTSVPAVDGGDAAAGDVGSDASLPWLPIAAGLGLLGALAMWWWRARD